MNYSSSYYYGSSAADVEAVAGAVMGVMLVYSIILIAIAVVELIGMWKMFTKAGEPGWKCLIPIYNLVILFKIAGISPWFILGYLLAFIPAVGWIAALALQIYLAINLAKVFGQSGGFAAGLVLLQPIFICILGFGKAEYQAPTSTTPPEAPAE